MKYGLTIFPTDYTMPPDEFARRAEEMGFESVWFPEHTHIPVERKTPWPGGPELPQEYYHSYDPFVALMAAGAATREIKLATGICLIVQRDPITTAKTIATLDQLSNGRFIFGIGGGWNREEMENHGTPSPKRFPVLRERVLAMKAMWTQEQAEFHGARGLRSHRRQPEAGAEAAPADRHGRRRPDHLRPRHRVLRRLDAHRPRQDAGRPRGQDGRPQAPRRGRRSRPGSRSASPSSRRPPTPDALASLERWGVDRIIFNVPCREPAEVVKTLESHAQLIR